MNQNGDTTAGGDLAPGKVVAVRPWPTFVAAEDKPVVEVGIQGLGLKHYLGLISHLDEGDNVELRRSRLGTVCVLQLLLDEPESQARVQRLQTKSSYMDISVKA